MQDIYEAAESVDEDCAPIERLKLIAREARKHGNRASIVADHVLVTSPEGYVLATRSAMRLVSWLGY